MSDDEGRVEDGEEDEEGDDDDGMLVRAAVLAVSPAALQILVQKRLFLSTTKAWSDCSGWLSNVSTKSRSE